MAEQPPPPGKGGDLKKLVKDKRFLAAAGVVGVVGLVVFMRRGGSGSAAAGDTPGIGGGQVPVGSAGYVQGGANTTGTDIAGWLSSYGAAQSAAQQQQLTDFGTQLRSSIDALRDTLPGTGTPLTFMASEGQYLDRFLGAANAANPGLGLTAERLAALNPGLNITQANSYGYINAQNPANRGGGGSPVQVLNVGAATPLKIR
jgi:hypothetical protein